MELTTKKVLSEHLRDAMSKEDLSTRQAAKYLNIAPYYLSMSQNKNSWSAMGKRPWERIEEWHDTRDKLSAFQIPEGEEVRKPKEKTDDQVKTKPEIKKEVATIAKTIPQELDPIKKKEPEPSYQETQRLKVVLDIEINIVVNGQNVQVK
jgi:hypothetical protein